MSVEQCADCGGRGKSLVHKPLGLCNHCTSVRNAASLADNGKTINGQVCPKPLLREVLRSLARSTVHSATKYEEDTSLFRDLTHDGSGRLLLRGGLQTVPLSSSPLPIFAKVGCPTKILFVTWLWDDDHETWRVVETNRDNVDGREAGGTDIPYELVVGRYSEDTVEDELRKEKMDTDYVSYGRCKAWDVCLPHCVMGSSLDIMCTSEWAYNHAGYLPNIPPDATIKFEIEIVQVEAQMPLMPTRAELERSRIEHEEEDRKRYEENPPPSFEERIKDAMTEKEKGNELVKRKDWAAAKKAYDTAFVNIFYSKEEYHQLLSDEERSMLDKIKVTLFFNRALCKLELNMFDEALWDSGQALEIDPENKKGRFRRCMAQCGRLSKLLEKENQGEFWSIEKGREMLRLAKEDLKAVLAWLKTNGEKPDHSVVVTNNRLKALEAQLVVVAKQRREAEKGLFKNKIAKGIDKQREQLATAPPVSNNISDELDDMPDLDD